MPRDYRSHTRIILDLLRAMKDRPGIGTTALLYQANLSHDRLQGFMAELVRGGFVAEVAEDQRRRYDLTERGQVLLTELDRVDRFMTDFGMRL